MKRKPILGETLYSLNVGNAFRRGVEQKLTPVNYDGKTPPVELMNKILPLTIKGTQDA